MIANDMGEAERLDTEVSVGPQLFSLLRGRIIRGALAPGVRLSETEIAAHYGTSRQPVREAFIKLAGASLIEVRPQRGSYVKRINVAVVLAAQFVREAVEADIVRRVAQQEIEAGVLRDLEDNIAAQVKVSENEDPQPFIELDEIFHRRLAELAGQGAGWSFLQPLKTQMDRVRHLSARQFPRRMLVQQHKRIFDAIKRRDPQEAEENMRLHLQRILEDIPAVIAANPEFFEQEPQ